MIRTLRDSGYGEIKQFHICNRNMISVVNVCDDNGYKIHFNQWLIFIEVVGGTKR